MDAVSALELLTLAAALSTGVVAGVFFAFSTFVMPALARLAASHGVAAMQAINAAALDRWFLGALFGAAALCLALALVGWGEPGARLRLAGAALYLVGAIGVTIACNVPRNQALQPLAPGGPAALALWGPYLREWTAWNHVRTLASIAASAAFTLALLLRR